MWSHDTKGFLVTVDGPNGSGKSTLIASIRQKLENAGYDVYTTREPTDTELGRFVRSFAENHFGISLACMVAADRYEHILKEIVPELEKGVLVIVDRYILSSLILQEMDGVSHTYVMELNSEIIRPDLQVAVFADESVLQKRLADRATLTRFERGSQSDKELKYMEEGIAELEKQSISVLRISNNNDIEANTYKIINYIISEWRKHEKISSN